MTQKPVPAVDALGQAAQATQAQVQANVQAFSTAMTDMWKTMSGLSLPMDAMAKLQGDYISQATAMWNNTLTAFQKDGTPAAPLGDKRFSAEAWAKNPAAALYAQAYLLNARTLLQMAESVQGDAKTKARIRFAVQQWVDAASPANYLATNPEALAKAIETKGESITQGLQLLWKDIEQGHMSQTDETVFEVGRNVATSEGAVVFENELFQLIEYKPLTTKVHARPMLFVPPCINKYYILDLQPENSVIRYTVENGHRVFVVSWRNPDASLAAKTWDDYIEQGPIAAIAQVQDITGSEQINTLGFCVGGTILATALAVLAARGEQPAASMTLLTTLLDFSETGILDVFVDEASVKLREVTIGTQAPGGPGLLKGKELATTFSFLRPNDLVWNYVVGNYLKGEAPPPFDLLYWNGDSTNLPGPMYCWYLRHTYLDNALRQPGALTVCGVPLDLTKVTCPVFIYGSREDHIVPWQAAYKSTGVLAGSKDKTFVLGASGHIAGVINPASKNKRSHWINSKLPAAADDWFKTATETPGSWWPVWSGWLGQHGGKQVPAPKAYGNRSHKVIEAAPGRYVKQKA
ncbi:PHA/PHB synthase family protein [Pseudaquabacterium pictum]|uniref:Poly-beta-hydroxybutyrate polymerase n=1 Tax=Pseudaquabacterium pictum TaxID=2315236 RepID=A0A480AI21_9BURK|nr:class I poly(R)-hydroxyalkanoic acid synthase [Rubrivivax pictus]GCL61063.1 poly-beta-hydroxybutyrate polymerase [Rubrivivax pictus]